MGTIKKFELEVPKYITLSDHIPIVASKPLHVVEHKCQYNNGGCSHICVSLGKYTSGCLCPAGMVFKDITNTTCIDSVDCEFRCSSGECLTYSRRCNGRTDCADGSDENECESNEKIKKICAYDQFACHDGSNCFPNEARCDKVSHCEDNSDEEECESFDHNKKCHSYQHLCTNGRCIDLTAICDGFNDCGDESDEKFCENLEEHKATVCGKNMFKCSIGSCIPKEWECDGHMDCNDGSDEHNKCATHQCPRGFIKCKFGQCIDEKLLCDGHNDCGDNSDEINCDAVRQIACDDELDSFGDPIKFQCSSEPTLCLDIRVKCNGTAECPRGEDEFGCSGCSIHEFQCKSNKECIRKEFRCDNQKDCNDGSDEIDCQSSNSSLHHQFATLCRDEMFHCKDGLCIDQLRVCDGSEDCAGGEDEGPGCHTACVNHACQHKCTPSPYGAICSCKTGYHLNSDKKSCADIDECTESQPCAQICENDYGSYRCGCYGGFMLRQDKTSCKSIDGEHYLLFTSSNQVRQLSENPMLLKVLWSLNDTRIMGLNVNVHQRKAYYTVEDVEAIFEYDLNNGSTRTIYDDGVKSKVSIDWVTNNVYVIDYSSYYSIKICNFFDKLTCIIILKFAPRDVIKTLTVDAVNRLLFYVVIHYHTFGDPYSIIYKTGLDGSKKTKLTSITGFVTLLECDIYKKKLYFIDQHTKTLQVLNYNGNDLKIVIKKKNVVQNPSGLSIFENSAFIINTGSSEAVRCQLYGDFSCQAFNINVYNSGDLVVVAKSRQKKVKNVCELNNCSLLCVQAELGSKCLCHEGEYIQEGVHCSKIPEILLKKSLDELSSNQKNTSSHGVTLGICLSLMFVILFGLFGYIYYKRRVVGHGKFNVNLHFHNPLNQQQQSPENIENQRNSSKIYKPVQRFFQNAKGCEISLDTKGEDIFRSFKRTSKSDEPNGEISDNESGDTGNVDDNPRARLVL